MRRRSFIASLMGATTIGFARAQEHAKQYRIAILDKITPVEVMNESTHPHYPLWAPLFKELRRRGYVEGQNLTVERVGIGNYSLDVVRKVVARKPDVIFADADSAVHDATTLTDTIPIVGFVSYFGAQFGRIATPAHPGGNLTGVSAGPTIELIGKRLELLREMVPNISRVGALYLQQNWELFKTDIEKIAKPLRIAVVGPFLETPVTEAEIHRTLAAMSKEGAGGLYVGPDVWMNTPLVIRLAQEFRLPAMYIYSYFAQIGGLMAYDYGLTDMGRIVADQIDQILKGTKPGDIPIYQAQNFTLTINLKTAKALGIAVPQALLARAEAIE